MAPELPDGTPSLTKKLTTFLIVERFKDGAIPEIGERFKRDGRMLPHSVIYRDSWIDPKTDRCFQIMDAPDEHALNLWTTRWRDLIDFEIIQVQASSDFWAAMEARKPEPSPGRGE